MIILKKKVFFPGIFVIFTAICLKYFLLEQYNVDFFESIVVNVITETISIIVTVVIIGSIIKKEEEKEKIKKEQKKAEEYNYILKDVIGNRLSQLYNELSSTYINFVTKEPLQYGSEGPNMDYAHRAIIDIVGNIDTHVGSDFRSKHVRTIIANKEPLKEMSREQIITYQNFCYGVFKSKYKYHLDKFIQQYISILPENLRLNIYSMENSVNSFVFITMIELTGQEFEMPTSEQEQLEIKHNLTSIGENLIEIYNLIKK